MSLQWPDGADDGAERVWQRVLVPIAAEMRAGAGELAAQAVGRMRTELPALFPDQQMVTEHLVSTEASLRQVAQVMPGTDSVTVLVAAQAGALRATVKANSATNFFMTVSFSRTGA